MRTSQKKSEKAGKLPTIEKRFFPVSQTAINAARFLQFGDAIKMQMLTAGYPTSRPRPRSESHFHSHCHCH